MITYMSIDGLHPIEIGHVSDNLTHRVEIDCSAWKRKYPALTRFEICVTRPDGMIYCPKTEVNSAGKLVWVITDAETAIPGEGGYQVIGTGKYGDRRASRPASLSIEANMPGIDSERAPDPSKPWVKKVFDAAAAAEQFAKDAAVSAETMLHPPIIGENGNWWLWDVNIGDYADSGSDSRGHTLPTASAETKGGVKVGSGLKMDGEVLNAEVTKQALDALSEEIGNQTREKPLVYIDGAIPTTKDNVLATMTVKSKWLNIFAYIKIKCQGTSSMNYDKKNFTVTLYQDEARTTPLYVTIPGWKHPSNKFVLKANYIDRIHARNVVGARLWGEIVASRHDYASLPAELRNSPNNGAVDGFPIRVTTNGTYQGIYTWNIGKNDLMWGMDEDNPNHVLMCAETNTDNEVIDTPCNFRALWSGVHEEDWSVEVGTNSDALKNSMNSLISYVKDTTDEEFVAQANTYLDIQSAIDYYIFAYVNCGIDSLAKNMLLGTYDLTKWYCGAYDLDSTWGMYWYGTPNVPANRACPEEYQEKRSLLWERIEALFEDRMRERYHELRKTVLSYANIVTHFERFVDEIGDKAYADDLVAYPGIPCPDSNTIWQIRNFVRDRLVYCDAQFSATKTMLELSEPAVFGGTVDDAINTCVKLWQKDQDFSIALDMTPAEQTAQASVFHLTRTGSPWPGIDMTVYTPTGTYGISVNGDSGRKIFDTAVQGISTARMAVVITHVAGSNVFSITMKANGVTKTGTLESAMSPTHDVNMWIGCSDGDRTPANPWIGTMNRFGIYGRVMTEAEVTAYLSAID